jgi:hypothetical protein
MHIAGAGVDSAAQERAEILGAVFVRYEQRENEWKRASPRICPSRPGSPPQAPKPGFKARGDGGLRSGVRVAPTSAVPRGRIEVCNLKGRLAEALVESIFRQSGYSVTRSGRESCVGQLVDIRGAGFLPDFVARRRAGHQRDPIAIEVKYRAEMRKYLQQYAPDEWTDVKRQCPHLYVVLVCDRPEDGGSCFRSVALRDYANGTPPNPSPLHMIPELRIRRRIVARYEPVAQRLFAALPPSPRPARTAWTRTETAPPYLP